ncbi:MAG TPA: hypothetical protein VL097_03100, partial [Rhodanobacter sp.]|nr:hypothetical protein [Rhodanobacter sp.]
MATSHTAPPASGPPSAVLPSSVAKSSVVAPSDPPRSNIGPMLIIGTLFFIFGFVTWLNGPLITFVKL